MSIARLMLRILPLLALVALTGCGGGSAGLPVSGTVTVKGQPLTKGFVRFVPDAARGASVGTELVGGIGPDGKYDIPNGVPPGWYKVSVATGETVDSTKPYATKSAVPARYLRPDTSGLTFEVKPNGTYNLALAGK